jgi:hypothetical protein
MAQKVEEIISTWCGSDITITITPMIRSPPGFCPAQQLYISLYPQEVVLKAARSHHGPEA